jgi:hypothetical protein
MNKIQTDLIDRVRSEIREELKLNALISLLPYHFNEEYTDSGSHTVAFYSVDDDYFYLTVTDEDDAVGIYGVNRKMLEEYSQSDINSGIDIRYLVETVNHKF